MTDLTPGAGGSGAGFAVTPALEGVSGQLAQAASDFGALFDSFTSTDRPPDSDFGVPEAAQYWAAARGVLEREMNVTALALQEAAGKAAATLARYGAADSASTSLSTGIGQALAGPTP